MFEGIVEGFNEVVFTVFERIVEELNELIDVVPEKY
jgi:hypothetical protein